MLFNQWFTAVMLEGGVTMGVALDYDRKCRIHLRGLRRGRMMCGLLDEAYMVGSDHIRPPVPCRYRMENTMPADVIRSPPWQDIKYMPCFDASGYYHHHSVALQRLSIERTGMAHAQVFVKVSTTNVCVY